MRLRIEVAVEDWPVDGMFTISRGSRRQATVIVATVTDGIVSGRGEAVPYARYGETVDGTVDAIRSLPEIASREALAGLLPAGAARNALDCALWELEARRAGTTVASLAGLSLPTEPQVTCYTLSLDTPEAMAAKAKVAADKPLLKLKLGGRGDDSRMRAVRAARPDARLVADANEAWSPEDLEPLLAVAEEVGMELVEQPLPAAQDQLLAGCSRRVALCADESAHTRAELARLRPLYDAVNIKLDKAGGLTEGLAMAREAKSLGFRIMVGCMLSTSLAMAPAILLAPFADWLDLDGPLLLAQDRTPAIVYRDGRIVLPVPAGLWG
jgi:L-alanine-DL-glutamate epimerase-like enolase superfamily enzyme